MTRRPPKDPINEPWKNLDGTPAAPPPEIGPRGQIWRGPGDPKPHLGVVKGDKDKDKKSEPPGL